MSTLFVDRLAQNIRIVDGGNRMSPHELGVVVAEFLSVRPYRRDSAEVIAFVKRTNPDKRIGAGRLAELIVAEFRLDEEGQ